jgi:hypothetical protein
MPDAVAAPPLLQRRKVGAPPFVPTAEQRKIIAALASFGISQEAMCELLKRDGVPCATPNTLRRAFRAELKHGREMMIAALGARMFNLATSDKDRAFSAMCFLLRTFSGPAWRVADARADEAPPADDAGDVVRFYLPDNHRREPAEEDTAPVIEGEVDGEDAA